MQSLIFLKKKKQNKELENIGFVLGTLMPLSVLLCGEGKGMRYPRSAFQFLTPEPYTYHLP